MQGIDIGLLEALLEDVKSGRIPPAGLRRLHERPYLVSEAFTEVKVLWTAPGDAVVSHDLSRAAWLAYDGRRVFVQSIRVLGCVATHFDDNAGDPELAFEGNDLIMLHKGDVFRVLESSSGASTMSMCYRSTRKREARRLLSGSTLVILDRTRGEVGHLYDAFATDGRELFHGFQPSEIRDAEAFGVSGSEIVLFSGKVLKEEPHGLFVSMQGMRGSMSCLRKGPPDDVLDAAFGRLVSSGKRSRDGKHVLLGCREGEPRKYVLYLDSVRWAPNGPCRGYDVGVYGFLEDGSPFWECRSCKTIKVEGTDVRYPTRLADEERIERVVGRGLNLPFLICHRYADNVHAWILYGDRKFVVRICNKVADAISLGTTAPGIDGFAVVFETKGSSQVVVIKFDRERLGYDSERRSVVRASLRSLTAIPGTDKLAWIVSRKKHDGSVKAECISVDGEEGMLHKRIVRLWTGDGANGAHHIRYTAEDEKGRLHCHGIRLGGK